MLPFLESTLPRTRKADTAKKQLRLDMGFFEEEDGNAACFQLLRQAERNLEAIKERGVVSHFIAQRKALLSWLVARTPRHAVIVRIFDDTNVWVHPQKHVSGDGGDEHEKEHDEATQAAQDASEAVPGSKEKLTVGRAGKRKVSPLLGMIQRIFLRLPPSLSAERQRIDMAQIHVPAQVLPKANTQKLYSRLQRWSVLSLEKQSPQMGGGETQTAWSSVPFKILATCLSAAFTFLVGCRRFQFHVTPVVHVRAHCCLGTDSLPANHCCAALDQQAFKKSTDTKLALINFYCAHHQACLAKKPVILAADGVASGVRGPVIQG